MKYISSYLIYIFKIHVLNSIFFKKSELKNQKMSSKLQCLHSFSYMRQSHTEENLDVVQITLMEYNFRFLSIQATSIPSERVFSWGRNISKLNQ